jgi:hypothetical protein
LTDPESALGRVAAAGLGRTGVVRTTADVSAWAGLAVAAGLVLGAATGLAAVAARRGSGLSSRFDKEATRPSTDRGTHRTAWEELSEGRDPTVDRPGHSPPGT